MFDFGDPFAESYYSPYAEPFYYSCDDWKKKEKKAEGFVGDFVANKPIIAGLAAYAIATALTAGGVGIFRRQGTKEKVEELAETLKEKVEQTASDVVLLGPEGAAIRRRRRSAAGKKSKKPKRKTTKRKARRH